MDVASLELCKELYELSGWGKTEHVYAIPKEESVEGMTPWLRVGVGDSYAWREHPAYDLGYLLRKLPPGAQIAKVSGQWNANGPYSAWVDENDYYDADTPEDATCTLAIELFKQDVLKRGEANA
jgi:hypothetical protein